eukprot:COSAG06_NODE_10005_length_1771_cov_1.879785_2_plen_25_part_01
MLLPLGQTEGTVANQKTVFFEPFMH